MQYRSVLGVVACALVTLSAAAETLPAGSTTPRNLTFDERVRAQTAIERVYYRHQIGATKSFEDAVPRAVIEAKVRKYLEESAALQVYWKTAVTDLMLERELERMASGSRMPERLIELYAALGNDAFMIKETLARATLVDRLAHNFYAFDSSMHAEPKRQADELHRKLAAGELSPTESHPNRTLGELAVGAKDAKRPMREAMTAEEFKERRKQLPQAVGEVSPLTETPDAYVMSVVLSEGKEAASVASYSIPKTGWDAWWEDARAGLLTEAEPSLVVAHSSKPGAKLPRPPHSNATCTAADSWDEAALHEGPEPGVGNNPVWTGSLMVVVDSDGLGRSWRYDPATDAWSMASSSGAPAPRYRPTAVWTGREVIMWGGYADLDPAVLVNTGGRYDPVADRWSPLATTGAPCGRLDHTAVWTGSAMVVWGGFSATGCDPNTGGRYDPTTDTWAATSLEGAPTSRALHTAIWTGTSMIVWGGEHAGQYLASGGAYNPVSDTWKATSMNGAPLPRSQHTAVWTGTSMIVWAGSAPYALNTGARYDPVANSWTPTSIVNAPSTRTISRAIWTGSVMVVWGGINFSDDNDAERDTGGRYDPASDSWTATSMTSAPTARYHHSMVWTGSLALVWGGTTRSAHRADVGGRYDPVGDSWTPMATGFEDGPEGRFGHTAVWTGSAMIVWGGQGRVANHLNTGGRYDPITDSWSATSMVNAPVGRFYHVVAWTGAEMIAWGGFVDSGIPDWADTTSTGGRYNPISDTWVPTSLVGAPTKRLGCSAVWASDRMVIWGGRDGSAYFSTGARYDPNTDTWQATSPLNAPTRRADHTAVWTGVEMIVWGGLGDDGNGNYTYRNSGARYDPVGDSWRPTSMALAPLPRESHSAVWTGQRMLIWGGDFYSGNPGIHAGSYDPITDSWWPISITGGPRGAVYHSTIWTGVEMIVWGGSGASNGAGDGGRYDAQADTWVFTSLINAPSARGGHTAVWTGNQMLVWGGARYGVLSNGGAYAPGPLPADDCDGDGVTRGAGDCEDGDASIFPGAPQLCDGINNDCSHPAWPEVPAAESDLDRDQFRVCQGDCNDASESVHPGAQDSCNGADDDCNGTIDDGGPSMCDDENICTSDRCNGTYGCGHEATPGQVECDDHSPCTLDDVCANRSCQGTPTSGPACNDGNACTSTDTCHNGACFGALIACNDDNMCTADSCDPSRGCVFDPSPGLSCDDGIPCTQDDCDPESGCTFSPVAEGVLCNDFLTCTELDHCDGLGSCVGDSNCDDHSPCTEDTCDYFGCVFTPTAGGESCDDASACTMNDQCVSGHCRGAPIDCDDHNACTGDGCSAGACTHDSGPANQCHDTNVCTTDACDPVTGCTFTAVPEGSPCTDSNACTIGEACHAGACSGATPLNCDDHTVCTDDSCSPVVGCLHDSAPGNRCHDTDACTADACDPVAGCTYSPYPNGHACDDGDPCRVGEACHAGVCGGSVPIDCDDHSVCTTDYCDPLHGCVHSPSPQAACDDGSACTANFCDPIDGCVFPPEPAGTPCNDYFACTLDDRCDSTGYCLGRSVCDDGNSCTDDFADEYGACACSHDPTYEGAECSDGNACTTGDACDGAAHCFSSGPLDCDDGNPCTDDSCDPATGCIHTPSYYGTSCDNANACDGVEYCDGYGTCESVYPPQCDDRVACTLDTCEPELGCVYDYYPAGTSCEDDGDACNGAEVCDGAGTCVSPTPLTCDDGNPCTDESCNPVTGCVHTDNSVACDDGNACTTGDVCGGGACRSGAPVICGAADQCHVAGVCNPATGTCSNHAKPDGTACDDADLCGRGETCQSGTCVAASSGLNEPNPRSTGYYKRLCVGPHSGDQLTAADAACVATVASTFAGVTSVADLCAELQPSQPNNDACDRADDDLMALALNICRARVCTSQGIDSQCGANGNVGQSLTESDGILSNPSRNAQTCAQAKCLAEEITTGRALEMNTLTLRREGGGVRLSWQVPYLDDGSGGPSKYHVWRRVAGSLTAFTKIGVTTNTTYLDAAPGAFEYEITAVLN